MIYVGNDLLVHYHQMISAIKYHPIVSADKSLIHHVMLVYYKFRSFDNNQTMIKSIWIKHY